MPPEPHVLKSTLLMMGYALLLLVLMAFVGAGAQSAFSLPSGTEPILFAVTALALWCFGAFAPIHRAFQRAQSGWFGRGATYALAKSKRAPVLYLRSFSFDTLSNVQPPALGGLARRIPTIEQELVLKLSTVAPVVALGRPGESEPALGAIRIYATHDYWSKAIEAVVPYSTLVVWTAGYTKGLQWEIEHLIKNLPPARLLLWTTLGIGGSTAAHEESWRRFLDAYGSLFPRPLPATIGDKPFVAFDDDWTPIEIPNGRYSAHRADPAMMAGLTSFVREKRR